MTIETDQADQEQDGYEDGYCPACAGSGLGMYENTTCWQCKGRGHVRHVEELDDPEYYHDDD